MYNSAYYPGGYYEIVNEIQRHEGDGEPSRAPSRAESDYVMNMMRAPSRTESDYVSLDDNYENLKPYKPPLLPPTILRSGRNLINNCVYRFVLLCK